MIKNMKIIRMKKGIIQWQLAKDLGVSESHLSRIENGRDLPSFDLILEIARALGVASKSLGLTAKPTKEAK